MIGRGGGEESGWVRGAKREPSSGGAQTGWVKRTLQAPRLSSAGQREMGAREGQRWGEGDRRWDARVGQFVGGASRKRHRDNRCRGAACSSSSSSSSSSSCLP